MSVCGRSEPLGRAMFWMALAIAPFTYMGSARTQHFAIGFTAGLFLTCLLALVLRRSGAGR